MAGDHQRHDHGRVRPDPLRPDDRGVLDQRHACPPDRGRAQLRPGAAGAPPVRPGALAPRPRAGQRLPERRPAQRVRRVRRVTRRDVRGPRRVRPERAAQHRRWLLRDDAGPHPRLRGDRPWCSAARSAAARHPHAPVRPRAADHPPARQPLRQRRRADQRHRLAQVRQAHPGRRLQRGRRDRPRAGDQRRPGDRREHGRGHARLGRGDVEVPPPHRVGAGHQPRAGSRGQLALAGHRSRAQVPPGPRHRELDQHEGGRGRVPPPGAAGPALRRGGHRHGLRRAGPGRHGRAEGLDRPTAPTTCS